MRVNFAGQQADLAGLVDLVRPMFSRLWETHGHEYT
jgi:hypothetical protein